MKLVRDFRSTDPIFKGCYGDLFLYSDSSSRRYTFPLIGVRFLPHQLLPTCRPSSPRLRSSPLCGPQCPPWQLNLPQTKSSSRKGRHHRRSGCGPNTSPLKHPDSTLAKKPSSSKEQVPKEQNKFPNSCSSCKCSRSPTPPAKSNDRKWKEAHTEDTCKLNSTLPVSSSRFDGFCSPMGSHSEATELQPPSVTSTPLGLGTPRQRRSISEESRRLLASLYTSPGFNLPGQPVAGLGNLMPSVPSIAGSHQVSSIWPASILTPGLPSPHLTIDQANSMYKH